MTSPIVIVLAILLLASFVFTFLGARTWGWGYMILVEAVFLAAVGFFILAAETLRINAALRNNVNTLEKQVAEATADVDGLRNGTKDATVLNRLRNGEPAAKIPEEAESTESLTQMDHELLIATRRRGRVWRGVTPAGFNAQTGVVQATVPAPTPAGINKDTVVYLFDDGPPQPPARNGVPQGPQFLGEFNVTNSAPQQVSLSPVQPWAPNDFETRRLAASRGPWIMYEIMPADSYEIYAGMTDDQLKQSLPPQSVNEFLRHGKDATNDDDPWRKVGVDADGNVLPPDQADKAVKTIYRRRLRDYATELEELGRRRVQTIAAIEATKKDIEQLKAAEEVGQKLTAFRTEEKQRLGKDLDGVMKEVAAVKKHLADLQGLLARAQQMTKDLMARNRQMAAELASRQVPTSPPSSGGSSVEKRSEPLALGSQ